MPRFPTRQPRETAAFPVRYAEELPPRVGPSVPARIDVRTGAPEMYEELARAGGKIADIGIKLIGKIRDAEDLVEQDTLRRKEKERRNALFLVLSTEWDAEARKKAHDEYIKDVSAQTSKSARVNRVYRSYLDRTLPSVQAEFIGIDLRMRKNRIEDEFRLNDQADYESGDAENFAKRHYAADAIRFMTPEKRILKIEDFTTTSLFSQARLRLAQAEASPTPEAKSIGLLQARMILDGVDKSTLSADQLEYMNELVASTKEQTEGTANAISTQIMFAMDDNADKSVLEKAALAEEWKALLKTANDLSPAEARVSLDRINKWKEGVGVADDLVLASELTKDITRLSELSPASEINYLHHQLNASIPSLSATTYATLNKLIEKRLGVAQSAAVSYVLARSEKLGILGKRDILDFQMTLRGWVKAQPPGVSPLDIIKYGAGLATTWKKTSRKLQAGRLEATITEAEKWEPPKRPRQTATHPETGERIEFRDGKWHPIP